MANRLVVALDGTPLAGPMGGIRRFTDQLLLALRHEFPADNYAVVSDQFAPTPQGLDRKWWLYGLNRALARVEAQVFHGTDFAVPYLPRIPAVMTVHDLSPWREPAPASARVRRRAGLLLRLRVPTLIHTPSAAVREELIAMFRWPADRVVAVPLAAAEHFVPTPTSHTAPYFLYLGTLEPRKNLDVLIAAMDLLRAQGLNIPLKLAGQLRDGYRLPDHPAVQWLGPQPEGDLPALLSNARAVLYPSRYEGFGLPVLEAMQCGATVIASDIPVHREVGGEAALYAPVSDPAAWASLMLAAERRPALSLARAAQYSWRQTARRMRELYQNILP
jgi:glycosyltransferase involved in cell wall biosynthesis